MAIHEDVPGIETTVRCQGQPLPELEDPNARDDNDEGGPDCPTTSKYIECVNNVEFEVHVRVNADYPWGYRNHVLVASTYVDGEYIRGSVIRNTDAHDGCVKFSVRGREMYSNETRSWSMQKFRFATVKTVDDAQKERVENDMKAAKSLGIVEVRFMRAIEQGPSVRANHNVAKTPIALSASGTFELAEKSLKGKAVSHGTSYGIPQWIDTPRWISARDVEEDNGPIVIYRFMYRSKEALKRELIIPRSRSSSPAFENLTPAERDRLARERLDEIRNAKKERKGPLVKREFGAVIDLAQDRPAHHPAKKSRGNYGEVVVIDLTDD
ncbi:hypothetical protein SAMD00023353_6800100 [Rosellinia necatrix]|uniref:DUF7918 domain-containing protein n=1 Tax=Rosellinia necatrix TaxID=77044 RepID=A0A1W2TTH4_ROSNE|nr:hypothetical protein SAMD00023353_6800100 [Rosellinia necatrix]